MSTELRDTPLEVGARVIFKSYHSPFKEYTGEVVGIREDKDHRKLVRYEILPDAPYNGYEGTVFRYHPRPLYDQVRSATGELVRGPLRGFEFEIEDVLSVA